MTHLQFDKAEFRKACGAFGTGVTVVSSRQGEVDHAMTANAFMSISLDPPIVAVSIADNARMCPILQESGKFAVSILPEGAERLAMHFAGRHDPQLLPPFKDRNDLPVISDASAWFTATVCDVVHVGDHHVFFGRVTEVFTRSGVAPMIYCQGRFGEFTHSAATGD
jgi:flavin reductase (DIM6/NTAB) family NADH-FMN oxidoreductase RutF